MNFKIILILGVALFSQNVFSQNSFFEEAEITKTDLTKQKAFVKITSESDLNPSIKYKSDLNSKETLTLAAQDIETLLLIEDSTLFKKVQYNYVQGSEKKTDYRLAKKILQGKAQLFKLQLPKDEWNIILEKNNTHVYIVLIDSNYYTLYQKESLNGNQYKLDKNYQNILAYLLRQDKSLSTMAQSLKFTDKSITNILINYNKQYPEIETYSLITKEKKAFYHGPLISSETKTYNNKSTNTDYKDTYVGFGYTIDYSIPAISKKLSSTVSLQYFRKIQKSSTSDWYLKLPVGFRYKFTNSNFNPFIGAGVTFNYVSKFDNDVYIDANLGAIVYKRYLLASGVTYSIGGFSKNGPKKYDFYFNIAYLFGN